MMGMKQEPRWAELTEGMIAMTCGDAGKTEDWSCDSWVKKPAPPNIEYLTECVHDLCRMATQKTAGQQPYDGKKDVSWENLERVKFGIICEAVLLVLSGKLEKIKQLEMEKQAAIDGMNALAQAIREGARETDCCGLCEFDGLDHKECPGFERNDCFKWRGGGG